MRLRERFLRPSFSTGVASSFCALLTWVNIPPALLGQSASLSVIPAGALICWSLIGGCILQGAKLPELAEMGLAHWILLGSWWIFVGMACALWALLSASSLVSLCVYVYVYIPTCPHDTSRDCWNVGCVGMGARAHLLGCATPHFACVWAFGVWVYVPYFFPLRIPRLLVCVSLFIFIFIFFATRRPFVLGKGIPEHVMLIALL